MAANPNTAIWGDSGAEDTTLLVHGLTGCADSFLALVEELQSEGSRAGGFCRQKSPPDAEIIPTCKLVEGEDTNYYDILYSAPGTTVDGIKNLLGQARTSCIKKALSRRSS